MTKILCLICCRGGSKGIPGKNIKKFAGKPLLHWTLENALGSEVFDEIFVSTDSKEIARYAEQKGVAVPFLRPEELATDTSDQMLTHDHVFEKLSINDNTHRVCVLLNNPFINSKIIKESYKIALSDNFDRLTIDCAEVGGDYIYFRQMQKVQRLLRLKFAEGYENSGSNRQSLETVFIPVNNLIWGKPSELRDRAKFKQKIILEGINPYFLRKTENFDLDDMDDWVIGEAFMRNTKKTFSNS